MGKFLVIKDSREKLGYDYPEDDYCFGTIVKKLDFGDYAVDGFETFIYLDRKQSVSEFAKNITEKRFIKLLENVQNHKYRFLICEFSFNELCSYPYGSNIPKSMLKHIRIRGNFLQYWVAKISIDYKINIIFADNAKKAEKFCYTLLKYIHKNENV